MSVGCKESADAIAEFVRGRTLEDCRADKMLRSAVERQFEIIGEAWAPPKRPNPVL